MDRCHIANTGKLTTANMAKTFVCEAYGCGMPFAQFDDLGRHCRLHAGNTVLVDDDMRALGQQAPGGVTTPRGTHGGLGRDALHVKLEPISEDGNRAGVPPGGGSCRYQGDGDGALGMDSSDHAGNDDKSCHGAGERPEVLRGSTVMPGSMGCKGDATKPSKQGRKPRFSAREMRRIAARNTRAERATRDVAIARRNRRQVRIGARTVKTEAERERALLSG